MRCIQTILLLLFSVTVSKAQISVFGKVDHIEPDGVDTVGGIALTVSGSTAPYTYTWNPGAINTKDISNKTAGQYTLNVTSASSQTYTNKYSIGYKVKWTNLNRATFRNDTLSSTITGASISSSVSKNTLPANTNGWFEYVLGTIYGTGQNYYVGFTDSISGLPNSTNDIDYGIYFWGQGQDVYSKEGAATSLLSANPKVGDVIRLERINDTVFYKINNVQVRKKVVTGLSSKALKLKANLGSTCKLTDVGCSFINLGNSEISNYVETDATVIHSSGTGIGDGKITVKPKYASTGTYTWAPSSATVSTLSSLTAGQYSLTAADSLLNKSRFAYNVGYKVEWTNLYKATLRNDTLSSTSAVGLFASAISKNTLDANTDGWFEFMVTTLYATSRDYYIGFTDSVGPNLGNQEYIDNGFYYWGQVKYMYSVEQATENAVDYNPNVSNIVRIQRVGDVITYMINGVAVRTLTITGVSQKKLKIRANLGYQVQLINVGSSFNKKDNISFPNYVTVTPYIKHSSGPGISDGFLKVTPKIPFANTYSWSPSGATTNTVGSLSNGQYKVTVKDSLANASSYYYNVGYKVKWTNLDLCSVVGDSLVSSATSNYLSSANSKNTLKSGENGWVEFVVDKITGQSYYIGLSDSLSPLMGITRDIDYGFNFNSSSNYLYSYEEGTVTAINTNLAAGDVVRIERSGNTIYYKVNNVIHRTVTVSGISAKTFKIKCAIQNADNLARVGCSFYDIDSTDFNNHVQLTRTLIKHNSGTGINDGLVSVSPKLAGAHTYSWLPGSATTSAISALSNGTYTLTIKDSLANTSTYNCNVGYKTQWTNLNTCFSRNDTIKGTGPNNTYNGNAYSRNILSASTNGWIEFVLKAYPANATWLGFTDSTSTSVTTLTEMNYGIQVPASSRVLYYYEGGTTNPMYSYLRIGDVIRIERSGNNIYYKVNGAIIRTVTGGTISAKVMKAKVRLQYNNELVNVGCSFGKEYRPAITHVSCPGSTNGSVYSNVKNGPDTYTYLWQPGSGTNSYITGQGTGTYSVTISSASDGTVTLPYDIGYKTRWSNLSNTTVSNDTLKQTRGDHANSWSNGATSLNTLPALANGWVEYVATSPLRNKVFGLLDTVISADNYTDIDFGVYLNANGALYTSNNGAQTSLVTYVPGDLIRIQRNGDTIVYKKNGAAIYTATVSSSLLQKDWKVKATIYEYGAAFENAGCSFSSFDIKEITVQDVNCVSGQNGIATFNALGGATPYSFYWDGGSLTSSATYTNLSVGVHSVQAIDNNSCTATQNFTVTRCPNWTTVNGGLTLNSKGDVTKSSGADSWNDNLLATADTFRLADTAFWLSFNAPDTASVYMIGFRSLEEDTTTQVTNYKLFLENSSVTLLETDNDGFYNKREVAKLTGTKDLKIQLTTQGIEYYSAPRGSSSYELLYRSRLFANRPFIIESQLYKTGSKVNHIRVSGDGN